MDNNNEVRIPIRDYIAEKFESHQKWLEAEMRPLKKASHEHSPRDKKKAAGAVAIIAAVAAAVTEVLRVFH